MPEERFDVCNVLSRFIQDELDGQANYIRFLDEVANLPDPQDREALRVLAEGILVEEAGHEGRLRMVYRQFCEEWPVPEPER